MKIMHLCPSLLVLCALFATGCASEEEALDWAALESAEQSLIRVNRRTEIVNARSLKCVDVPNGSPNAVGVGQFDCHRGRAQQFRLIPVPVVGVVTQVRNDGSGKCLALGTYRAGNDSYDLIQATCNINDRRQQWELVDQIDTPTGGEAFLSPLHDTRLCLDVPNGSLQNSVQLQAYRCHQGANQRFAFVHW